MLSEYAKGFLYADGHIDGLASSSYMSTAPTNDHRHIEMPSTYMLVPVVVPLIISPPWAAYSGVGLKTHLW